MKDGEEREVGGCDRRRPRGGRPECPARHRLYAVRQSGACGNPHPAGIDGDQAGRQRQDGREGDAARLRPGGRQGLQDGRLGVQGRRPGVVLRHRRPRPQLRRLPP